MQAVIGAFELGDHRPPGEGARRLDREDHGFRTGIGKAQLLDARHALAQELGKIDFERRGQPDIDKLRRLPGKRLDHRREAMAMDGGGEIADHVEIAIAFDIDDISPLARGGIERIRRKQDTMAGIAARHDVPRTVHQSGGAGIAVGKSGHFTPSIFCVS